MEQPIGKGRGEGRGWELTLYLRIYILLSMVNLMPELPLSPLHSWLFTPIRGLRNWALED
jgi:hypothetical protein